MAAKVKGPTGRFKLAINATIGLLFLLVAGAVGVSSANVEATRTYIDDYLKANSKVDVLRLTHTNMMIDQELDKLVSNSGADRAMVARFHDGKVDTQGIHFLFLTRTNEINRPGVGSVITQTQSAPLAVFGNMLESFERRECFVLDHTSATGTTQESQFYNKLGVKSMVRCPVFNEHGILAGAVGVEFTGDEIDTTEVKQIIDQTQTAAQHIGHIFTEECNKVVQFTNKHHG